jgi:hypothetical protein
VERKVGRQPLEIGFFARMLAAWRGAAAVASARLVYAFVQKEVSIPLGRLCRLAQGSRAGFYLWRGAPMRALDSDLELRDEIQRLAVESTATVASHHRRVEKAWLGGQPRARLPHPAGGQPAVLAPAKVRGDHGLEP